MTFERISDSTKGNKIPTTYIERIRSIQNKMNIIIIYFLLFTFWAENSLGFSSIANVKGISLPNLGLYLLLLVWAFSIGFRKKVLEWNSVNTYIILFIFFVILSIPYKMLLE